MQSPRRRLRTAVCSDRLFAVAIVVALLEGLVRIGLAAALEPFFGVIWLLVVTIGWPPLVAVLGLAAVVPTVRDGLEDGDGRCDDAAGWTEGLVDSIRRVPPLVALAVLGHWVAIVGGAVLFLVIDTPVRYGLYWIGFVDLLSFDVAVYGTFVGIGIGTLLAWTVPAIAVVRIGDGDGIRSAIRASIATPVTQPRSIAVLLAGHLAFVGFLVGVVVVLTRALGGIETAGLEDGPVLAGVLIVCGLVLVSVAGVWLAWALRVTVRRFVVSTERSAVSNAADAAPSGSVPIGRLVVACLLVTALVGTAGAVRTNEIRPIDTSPEPFPDDPDGVYVTALENTDRTSHEYRWYHPDEDDAEPVYELHVDRADRQLWLSLDGVEQYHTTGLFHTGVSASLPGYAMLTEDDRLPRLGEPAADAANWSVVAEDDEQLTLEVTDPDDVYLALTGTDLEETTDEPEVHESWARVIVDTERKILSHGEFRLNVSDSELPDDEYDAHSVIEYEIGADVERPAELGSPTLGERLWRLFVY